MVDSPIPLRYDCSQRSKYSDSNKSVVILLGEVAVDAFVNIDCNAVKIPKGQRLFYSKFSGVRFNKDGEKYTSLAFSEVVAIC